MEDNSLLISLLPIAIIIAFPIFFSLVIWLISFVSGWQKLHQQLSQHHPMPPSSDPQNQKTLHFVSARIGFANYNNALTVTTGNQGITLATSFFFRAGHAPIFIPWSDIQALEFSKPFLNYRWATLKLIPQNLPQIRLQGRVFEQNQYVPLRLQPHVHTPESIHTPQS